MARFNHDSMVAGHAEESLRFASLCSALLCFACGLLCRSGLPSWKSEANDLKLSTSPHPESALAVLALVAGMCLKSQP